MHHGYTIAGTVTAGSAALVAQLETVRAPQGMPWWVPLACTLIGVVPSVLAFLDKRSERREKARESARFDLAVDRLSRPSIDRPDIARPAVEPLEPR